MEAIGENGNEKQGGQQPHPDSRREEAGTVTGIRELSLCHIEALNLKQGKIISERVISAFLTSPDVNPTYIITTSDQDSL